MLCTEGQGHSVHPAGRLHLGGAALWAGLMVWAGLGLSGCATTEPPRVQASNRVVAAAPLAATAVGPVEPIADAARVRMPAGPGEAALGRAPVASESPVAAGARPPPRFVKLGPPGRPRSLEDLRQQAAERLVAAHPDTSYVAPPPAVLLAIPILEIELHADGSVRRIRVLREPGQAPETTQLALAAVHRAAPFGDVSRLKKPWKFVEVFLFDDERRFMPRTLDRW